jgi:serine/alanine adding enzyme
MYRHQMSIKIKAIEPIDAPVWDEYVYNHPKATLYHMSGWKNVIDKTYGPKTYYLMAIREPEGSQLTAHSPQVSVKNYDLSTISYEPKVIGILPLVHLKHLLFGNSLISIPFFDLGGILADAEETEKALLSEALKLAQELKAANIELRHIYPVKFFEKDSKTDLTGVYPVKPENRLAGAINPINFATRSHKVRMLLNIPESSEILMKSFKAKLRSQIKKPLKEGLKSKVGGVELLDDFYKVFSINMRDLGSPVHSKSLMKNVLEEFSKESRIIMVYKDVQPIACSLIIGFKDTLENPWASALRQYSRLSPNMLLYWTMLEYACDNGLKYFDFGRSSPDEGTYKFKEQWGAIPTVLHWHYIALDGQPISEETSEKSKFEKAIRFWQKIPVPITKIIGPMIRKHIGL